MARGLAMKQQTLAMAADQGAGFERYRRRTKREDFLDAMNAIVPWAALCAVIEPHYPKAGNGRPPIGLERMLRIHLLQHWFNLADNAVEEALYDIASLRRFVGIDLGVERVPDETTVLKFRHLLEQHDLGKKLFAEVGRVLHASGFQVKTGTIVDATLIGAPSSTKNADQARDPEMHQTRKGRQWYFGMKLHIGVDCQTGLAHSAVVTAANVHDKHPLPDLLHGNERRMYGDSAYASQKELIASKAPHAKDFTNERGAQPQRRSRRAQAREEPQQVQDSRARRACLRGRQAAVGLQQSALPRPSQERHPGVHRAGSGQLVHVPKATHGLGASARAHGASKDSRLTSAGPPKRAPLFLFLTAPEATEKTSATSALP